MLDVFVQGLQLFVAVSLILQAGVVIHELGHALTARRLGARVGDIVVGAGEKTRTYRIAGIRVHFRSGRQPDERPKEPWAWAAVALDSLDADKAIRVLKAGPLAESVYGVVAILLILAAPLGVAATVLLAMTAAGSVCGALLNLRPNGAPGSDGVRIASIRTWQSLIRHGVAAPRPTTELLTPPVAS